MEPTLKNRQGDDLLECVQLPDCEGTAFAALRIKSSTTSGFESIGTWLEVTSIAATFIRFAANNWTPGLTLRSTVYQLGLRLPCRAFDFLIEQVGHWHTLGRVDEFLLRLGQVAAKEADAAHSSIDCIRRGGIVDGNLPGRIINPCDARR
jgi:hypothetical protein